MTQNQKENPSLSTGKENILNSEKNCLWFAAGSPCGPASSVNQISK